MFDHLVANGRTLAARSFGQPGLPQSFFVSREVFGSPKGPNTSLRVETRSTGLSCRSRASALCACSGRPAIALLAAAMRMQVIVRIVLQCHCRPGCGFVIAAQEEMGMGGPARVLSPADQVGSGAWHARSARSPLPARRARLLPSRRKPCIGQIGIEHQRAIDKGGAYPEIANNIG